MIGSAFAAASGILLAPAIGLDAVVLTLVVVQAFGAAAVGRFQSTTLGVRRWPAGSVWCRACSTPRASETSCPSSTTCRASTRPSRSSCCSSCCWSPEPTACTSGRPRERLGRDSPTRGRCWRAVLVLGIGIASSLPFAFESRLPVYTLGGGVRDRLRLALPAHRGVEPGLAVPGAFVAVGATTFCHVTTGLGLPVGRRPHRRRPDRRADGRHRRHSGHPPVGALPRPRHARASVSSSRSSSTRRGFMFGAFGSRTGARPDVFGLSDPRPYYFLCVALAIGSLALVVQIRRSRLGRLLDGLADSPVALATHGSSINVTRVLVFCISSFLAGIAGALYVGVVGSVSSSGREPDRVRVVQQPPLARRAGVPRAQRGPHPAARRRRSGRSGPPT